MSDLGVAILVVNGWIFGVIFGYICWGPDSRFKRNFIEGLTLSFIWKRKK